MTFQTANLINNRKKNASTISNTKLARNHGNIEYLLVCSPIIKWLSAFHFNSTIKGGGISIALTTTNWSHMIIPCENIHTTLFVLEYQSNKSNQTAQLEKYKTHDS